MRTPTAVRWIAAAGLAAAFVAACALLFTAARSVVDDEAAPAREVPGAPAPVAPGPAAKRVAAPPGSAEPDAASVEIDDTPLAAEATGSIRGTVRDDLGHPIEGAWISAWVLRILQPEPGYDASAKSLPDGTYLISDLDPKVLWRLEADAHGHAHARPAGGVAFGARRLDVTVDVVLPRRGSIELSVTGADDRPLRFTERVVPVEGVWNRSDVDSARLAPGRYRVSVESDGHSGESRVVEVAPGERTRAEFRLADEAAIAGALLDSDGAPLERFEVVAVAVDQADGPAERRAVTASDGTFRIGGLRRTRYRVAPADAELAADTPGDVLAPASGVRVQVRPESKVAFRLVYPADFTNSDRSADVRVDVGVRGRYVSPSPRWDGDAGTFRVPGGEDADVAITVVHCLTVWRRVRVSPGNTFDLGDVRPERAGEFGGRVVDAAGDPVAGAAAYCTSADWVPRQISDDEGRFRFERTPRAGCTVVVEADGFVPLRFDARGDAAAPSTLTLQRGGLLWVRCETRAGTPVAGARVRVGDERNEAWTVVAPQLDARGECAARLPPGTWRIDVAGCAAVTAEVREGATTTVRVRPH